MGYFYIVSPKAMTNYLKDPSFESWGRLGGAPAVWTRSSVATAPEPIPTFGWRGIYGVGIVEAEYVYQEVTLPTTGVKYTATAYVYVSVGTAYLEMSDATTGNNAVTASTTVTGKWVRLEVSATRAAAGTRVKIYAPAGALGTNGFYVDAVQLELGDDSMYCDGDEPDCRWNGLRFVSSSSRGRTRLGGELVALDDATAGIGCEMSVGLGAPDVETQYEPNAETVGGTFKMLREDQRTIVLKLWAAVSGGTDRENLHTLRASLLELVRPSGRITNREPFTLVYTGNDVDLFCKCHYQAGLEGTFLADDYEFFTLTMVSDGPFWEEERDVCVSLDTGTTLTVQRVVAKVNGVWGQLGDNPDATVYCMEIGPYDGGVYIGGDFANIGAAAINQVAMWDGADWVDLSAPAGDYVESIAIAPNGYVWISQKASGSAVRTIRYWDGSSWTALGVTLNDAVNAIAFDSAGTVFVAGAFANVVAYWGGAAWVYPATTVTTYIQQAFDIVIIDDVVYIGGVLIPMATPYGAVVAWDYGATPETTTDVTGDLDTYNSTVYDLFAQNGLLYAGGNGPFLAYNGSQWVPLHDITAYTTATFGFEPYNSGILFIRYSDQNLLLWTEMGLLPFDCEVSDVGGVKINRYGDIFMHYEATVTDPDQEFSTSQIVDSESTAPVFPKLYAISWGGETLQSVWNETTGMRLYGEIAVNGLDEVVCDLETGEVSSRYSENLSWLPGSDVGEWALEPGENLLSVFSPEHGNALYMVWRPRHWSVDR